MIPLYFRQKSTDKDGKILISVLIVLLLLMIIFLFAMTYALSRFSFHKRKQNQLIAEHLSEAGITRGLNFLNNGLNNFNQTIQTDHGEFTLSKTAWGPYWLVFSQGKAANQVFQTTALVGNKSNSYYQDAVTVCDERFPFVVAGNTRIYGDVNTGSLGMETGRIKGESISRSNYHDGEIKIYQNLSVPKLDSTIQVQYIDEMLKRKANVTKAYQGSKIITNEDENILLDNNRIFIENNLVIKNFEFNSTDTIFSIFVGGYVEIKNDTKISGLLEIIAEGPIYITDSAYLDNVIVFSEDSIIFSGDSFFSGMAISKSMIKVTDKAKLIYPTMLLVNGSNKECDKCGIYIEAKTNLEALCLLEIDNDIDNHNYQIYVDTSVILNGAISSEGLSDIRGQVNGSVITEQFKYSQPPTTYINWVKDFYVNRGQLQYKLNLPVFEDASFNNSFTVFRMDKTVK